MTTTATHTKAQAPSKTRFSIPAIYRIVFLFLEPLSTISGAVAAHFFQKSYLDLTDRASSPPAVPTGMSVALSQLGNLYFFLAMTEALVLRSTSDLRVWRTLLFVLLVADVGHVYSLRTLGSDILWNVSRWNAIHIGNLPVVYFLGGLRAAFLANVGLGRRRKVQGKGE